MVDTAVDTTTYTPEEQADQISYTSRSQPYTPCVAPPPDVLLEELRKRSPAVVPTKTMQLLGDGSEWQRQVRAERTEIRQAVFEHLHLPTGWSTIKMPEAVKYQAKLDNFSAAGIVCGKDETTGKPLFTHADGWSSRDKLHPVMSAALKSKSIHKEKA